jgi:hypothetical protein
MNKNIIAEHYYFMLSIEYNSESIKAWKRRDEALKILPSLPDYFSPNKFRLVLKRGTNRVGLEI